MQVLEVQQNQPREQKQSLQTSERHCMCGMDSLQLTPRSEAMPKHELWNTSPGVAVRTSVLYYHHQTPPLAMVSTAPLRRVILNIDNGTRNLYSDR